MDLEVGLPEAINLTVADLTYVQELDYEKLPFKCRFCHGYGHFARYCKKKEEEVVKEKGDQWTQVKRSSSAKQGKKAKGKKGELGTSSNPSGQKENGAVTKAPMTQNIFEVLSILKEQSLLALEEGEVPQTQIQTSEEGRGHVEPDLNTPVEGHSPTYA